MNSWNLTMKTTTNDPIVAEVRAARDKHAAQFGYNIKGIFKSIRDQQQTSGRKYVRYPARPAAATTTEASTE
jgi:hypothetical protein